MPLFFLLIPCPSQLSGAFLLCAFSSKISLHPCPEAQESRGLVLPYDSLVYIVWECLKGLSKLAEITLL